MLSQSLSRLEKDFPPALMACVNELPVKLPHYGTLVGLLSTRADMATLVAATVELSTSELNSAFQDANFRFMKQIVGHAQPSSP
ncbi:hypothetical protein HK405_012549 [Cladochytrium tenue]|nr:hypothetical protein HK405_012549 [Cladochytrium tenue]